MVPDGDREARVAVADDEAVNDAEGVRRDVRVA